MVPQSRPRVFFIGTSPWMRRLPLQKRLLRQGPQRFPSVPLIDFLDKVRDDECINRLSFRQQCNLDWQAAEWSLHHREEPGIFDVARDPARTVESSFSIGSSRTLRTNCSTLWVLPPTTHTEEFGPRGRLSRHSEKCRLAGIVPASMQQLIDTNGSAVDVAVGNCIPVPLIGSVMLPLLLTWQAGARAELLNSTGE
eukprot:6876687-Pyramimonas_sp.AAC.1